LTKIGIPYAIIASLDIMCNSQNTFISPSLQVRRVVNWNSPAFVAVRDIRWLHIEWPEARQKLAGLFDSGQASPLDVLPDGMTLAEVSFSAQEFVTRKCHIIRLLIEIECADATLAERRDAIEAVGDVGAYGCTAEQPWVGQAHILVGFGMLIVRTIVCYIVAQSGMDSEPGKQALLTSQPLIKCS
jgi:hypothetical protein